MADYGSVETALQAAAVNDLRFLEEPIQSHPDACTVRIGCRPVSACGVPLPDPKLVVYVRATDSQGAFWYVLDWLHLAEGGRPRETPVESEADAKKLVLSILKTIYPETLPSGPV